jgi:hypothetical protein
VGTAVGVGVVGGEVVDLKAKHNHKANHNHKAEAMVVAMVAVTEVPAVVAVEEAGEPPAVVGAVAGVTMAVAGGLVVVVGEVAPRKPKGVP